MMQIWLSGSQCTTFPISDIILTCELLISSGFFIIEWWFNSLYCNCSVGASGSPLHIPDSPSPFSLNPDSSEGLPTSAFLAATLASSPRSCQLLNLSFWLYLGRKPTCGGHVITPCLLTIESPCFPLGHDSSGTNHRDGSTYLPGRTCSQ